MQTQNKNFFAGPGKEIDMKAGTKLPDSINKECTDVFSVIECFKSDFHFRQKMALNNIGPHQNTWHTHCKSPSKRI